MAELSARRLEIVHQEPLLRLTTERRGTRELYTDFRGASISATDGMNQLIVTGGWEGDVLVLNPPQQVEIVPYNIYAYSKGRFALSV